jgi:hypothetical protein
LTAAPSKEDEKSNRRCGSGTSCWRLAKLSDEYTVAVKPVADAESAVKKERGGNCNVRYATKMYSNVPAAKKCNFGSKEFKGKQTPEKVVMSTTWATNEFNDCFTRFGPTSNSKNYMQSGQREPREKIYYEIIFVEMRVPCWQRALLATGSDGCRLQPQFACQSV